MRAASSFDTPPTASCDSDPPQGSKIDTKGGNQTRNWLRGGGEGRVWSDVITSKYPLNSNPI